MTSPEVRRKLRRLADLHIFYSHAANVLVGLGALCAIAAAPMWRRVASVAQGAASGDRQSRDHLTDAATFTALALALAGFGYLVGRFTGRF